jgi:SAM-dependent methyltransferase
LDSSVLRPLLKRYRGAPTNIKGNYHVVECGGCGTIYQAEVGDAEMLSEVYDTWLNTLPDAAWTAHAEWLATYPRQSRDGHEIMTVAAMMRTPLAGLKTLDYGMGQGLWARISRELGCKSYGFDLSERCMRVARAHGVETIGFDDLANGEFDFVNTEQVIEHVTDLDGVMGRLVAALRPEGILKISVPAQNRVRCALSQLTIFRTPDPSDLDPIFPLEHVNAFSGPGLETLGKRFGLSRVAPTRRSRLAFLRDTQGWSIRFPKNTVKELVRPFMSYEAATNLTMWFQRPIHPVASARRS